MNFVVVDIALLVLFVIFVSFFLYRNKKNLKRDGLLYLYRAKWGMNLIEKTGKKYQRTLKFLSYISVGVGYILMASMLYLFGKMIYLYIAFPSVVRAIKVPPITPLIPYLPQAFKLDFLPPFYFIYWIVILAVIAITHEFAHGIFMKRYGIKIKSTGFGFFPFFLPIFLAAFVEQDEKSMEKSKTFHQLSVLSAGTFANILTAILFFGVMVLLFVTSFAPAGAQFNTYSYAVANVSFISSVNGINLDNPTYENLVELSNETGYNKIKIGERNFVATKEFLEEQKNTGYIILYDDAPAINAGLKGAITSVDGVEVHSWDELGIEVMKYSPGDKVEIITTEGNYEIVFGENPDDKSEPMLGIGYREVQRRNLIGKTIDAISSFKKDYIYYAPKYEAAEFIFNFVWWLVLISFSVALVNMLPMGIFDGGKFFYMTIFAMTNSKRKAERWFKGITTFLLLLLLVLMFFWAWSFVK